MHNTHMQLSSSLLLNSDKRHYQHNDPLKPPPFGHPLGEGDRAAYALPWAAVVQSAVAGYVYSLANAAPAGTEIHGSLPSPVRAVVVVVCGVCVCVCVCV